MITAEANVLNGAVHAKPPIWPTWASRLAPGLFAGSVFASAALVFAVEPMVAKLVLPTLGGSPAVWNTSLAFFQAALLLGYAYAHLLQRLGSVRHQVLVHICALVAAMAAFPLHISRVLGEPGSTPPALWLLGTLTLSIGAPFVALTATAPLAQAWYARTRTANLGVADPYNLYAASNLGSLIALIAYPVIVEPLFTLRTQTVAWSFGYGAFALLMAVVGYRASASGDDKTHVAPARLAKPSVTMRERLTWVGLAAAPSSLMLGVTNHISTDIASAPFLWVAPLALYLVSFIIAFQTRPQIPPGRALLYQASIVPFCLVTLSLLTNFILLQLTAHLLGFFLTALVCHQALASRRPPPARLTEFYLLMSLGGVIGGGFNAFIAPHIFNTVVEYPLVLILACLARPWGQRVPTRQQLGLLIVGLACAAGAPVLHASAAPAAAVLIIVATALIVIFLLRDHAWLFILASGALTFGVSLTVSQSNILKTERGFYGVSRIDSFDDPNVGRFKRLIHGTTLHGAQANVAALRCRPSLYYAAETPIGQVFESIDSRAQAKRVGVIGMGAGSVAAYVRPTDSLRFFEIDPLIVRIATDPANFSYIRGCARGRVDWVLGDARLTLHHEPSDQFDVLLIDAFSGDSVPTHLLTVEAMREFLSKVKPDGVVVIHLSNRNLELLSPVAGAAVAAGGVALEQRFRPTGRLNLTTSPEDALIVARSRTALRPYLRDPRWQPALSHGVRLWTDDYTNLFGALLRRLTGPSA